MPLLRSHMRSVAFVTIALLILFICIFSTNALSQETLPKGIRVGIRDAAFPIGNLTGSGQYDGFCGAFIEELRDELSRQSPQIRVTPLEKSIENQYRGKNYPRFGALLDDKADIECGPNSRSSLDLKIEGRPNKTFGDEVELSTNNFYRTGIRLLLKKDTAEELEKASSDDLQDQLQKLKIAVLRHTTTLQQFEAQKQHYKNYVPYPIDESLQSKYDIRDIALKALEDDKVRAFASDAVILQTLFEKGVQGEPEFRKDREPYKDRDQTYTIFPLKGYLRYLDEQLYAIAIRKNTKYSDWLRTTIDKVLDNPNLSQAKQEIKNYEDSIAAPSVDRTPDDPTPDDPTIIVAKIAAAAAIIVAIITALSNPAIIAALSKLFGRRN